ncbi:MAG: glycoside hydrolase 5 family protein, partial [Halodesulfurarchaeum sp.]
AEPDPEPTETSGGDMIRELAADTETVRQGSAVSVHVELDPDVVSEEPHDVRLRSAEEVLQEVRLSTASPSTRATSFIVQCDRAGTRTFAVGDEQTSVTVESWPDSFVSVDGTQFALDGEPFSVVGANNAYLHHKTHKTVDEIFDDAAAMGLNVIRLLVNGGGTDVGYCREFACGQTQFGLQPGPREYDEASFRKLDYVIASAKRHGIRLIPSLITPGPGGIEAYVEWVDSADTSDDFYTNKECKAIYRSYLEHLLTRENVYTGQLYRDDPTIMLWELVNEPELTEGSVYGPPLQSWLKEMAEYAKSIDRNHLVSAGLIGWNDPTTEDDFLACFAPDAIDAASTHMYYDADGIDDWVERHASGVHAQLEKPVYIGEFGWDATRTEEDYAKQLENRNEGFERWYAQFDRHNVAGSLVWFLIGHLDDGSRYPDHDGFGLYYPEDTSTVEIIQSAAASADTDTGSDR